MSCGSNWLLTSAWAVGGSGGGEGSLNSAGLAKPTRGLSWPATLPSRAQQSVCLANIGGPWQAKAARGIATGAVLPGEAACLLRAYKPLPIYPRADTTKMPARVVMELPVQTRLTPDTHSL